MNFILIILFIGSVLSQVIEHPHDPDVVKIVDMPNPNESKGQDYFGIPMLYKQNKDVQMWDGRSWDNGVDRTLKNKDQRDLYDTTGMTQWRGNGHVRIFGNGEMEMSGSSPRFYINGYSKKTDRSPVVSYLNTEFTVYHKRIDGDKTGKKTSGCTMAQRSWPNGHAYGKDSNGIENTNNADTYYFRARYDDRLKTQYDFIKEAMHPSSASTTTIKENNSLWNDNGYPFDKWVGFKSIVYNTDYNTVKFEAYIDKKSNGDPELIGNKDNWELIDSFEDDGKSWKVALKTSDITEKPLWNALVGKNE